MKDARDYYVSIFLFPTEYQTNRNEIERKLLSVDKDIYGNI